MKLKILIAWGVITTAYIGVLALRPGTPAELASYASYLIAPLLAAAALRGAASRSQTTAARRAWALLALACATWALASAVWMVALRIPAVGVVSDLLYVVYGLAFLGGVLSFPSGPAQLRAPKLVALDILAVALGVGVSHWAWVSPVYLAAHTSSQLLSTGWLTLNAFIVATLLVKTPRRKAGRRATWVLLIAAATGLATADAVYHLQLLSGENITGSLLDGLWAVGFLLLGVAAYARQHPFTAGDRLQGHYAIAGDVVVYATLFGAGAAIVWRALQDGVSPPIVVMAAALSVVSVVRQLVIAADHAALTNRLQSAGAELGDLLHSYETSLRVGRMSAWEWRASTDTLRWSPHAELILGVAPSTYREWQDMVHPDHRATMRQRIIDAQAGKCEYELELRVVRPDGAILWVAVSATVVRDQNQVPIAMVGNLLDITDRKTSELELQNTTALLEHVMTASPIHTFAGVVERGEMVPRYVSENIARLLGGEAAEYYLASKRWEHLVHPEDLAVAQESNLRAIASGYSEHEVRMRHDAGHYLWFRTVLRVASGGDGSLPSYVGCMVDITASRSTEQQLRQAQKMEAVGQLAGGFAHDFNNLLTAIGGYAEQAQLHSPAGGAAEGALTEVLKATRQAAVLIDQLMTFSRRQDVRPADVDVHAAINGMAAILRTSVGEAVQLRLAPGPAGLMIKLPPGQLEQMLLNLAVNARDAMALGGVLTITATDVELGAHDAARRGVPRGRYVELAVADTGSGMTAETLSHVFEPFFTTKAPGSGTGLGLPMVYGIVTQAGGVVSIDSAPGRGTTVSALLPLCTDVQQASPEGVAGTDAAPALPGGSRTILLVEDQPQVRALVAAALEREGHRVIVAGDGLEALAALEVHQGPLDLILTDIVMPGMSGVELAAQLETTWPQIPVLFMSGYADVAAGSISPHHGFLRKPFSIAELTQEVQQRLPVTLADPKLI